MPTEGIGVYGLGTAALLNAEISSTYEGRHLTFLEADITGHEHAFPTKGHPVVISDAAPNDFGHIVGVALTTATAIGDYVAIDTEGIWYLEVVATALGNAAVTHGDELFINKSTAVISRDNNKVTNCHFGYALGGVAGAATATIAVKVHWDPDDIEEQVGVAGTPYISATPGKQFRQYYYEATGGGLITADHLSLVISTVRAGVARTMKRVLTLPGDEDRVGGYSAVGEFELNVLGVGNAIQHTMTAVKLAFENESTLSINNYQCAFIQLADNSAISTAMMPRLFHFISEPAVLRDAGVDNDRILTDCATDHPMNASIRIGYGPNATPLYIMCTTNAPD